jgi:serine phosphatase RsbU (regulator of sigma subunit)/DNA-binding response OmpR family regulator/anti-sigma regulatory factor (Ser/Thr protein kinase)
MSAITSNTDGDVAAPILVVDDREDSLRALCAVLEPLGHRVVTARSGDEALRHLLREQVAVILLDVNMPGLDGFSTAAMIKHRQRTRDIPIIFLTADRDASERGHVQLGYSSGAVDFLVKPYDAWALVSKVSVFIELHRRAEQLRHRIDELQASQAALRDAQRIARLAHFRVDTSTGEITWSDSAAQLFGQEILVTNDEATPFPFWQELTDPEPPRDLDQIQTQWTAPDGPTLTVVARVEFVRDRNGRVQSLSGTVQDITEHAEVRRALAATTDLLQRERETATLLQAALLPNGLPEAPGLEMAARYLPAEVGVGGDWFDASIQPDGCVLLAIGDVAGHGIAAATAMNEIRIACRAFSLNESSPSRILQKVNNFSRGTRGSDLVTALIVMLDPVTGEATVASAGHLPPLVARGGRAGFVDMHVTPPLGVSVAEPEETRFVIEPGATLLLYTDGLVERRNRSIDDRMQELADVLRDDKSDNAAGIVENVVSHMLQSAPPSDDVALIAVKRSTDRGLCIRLPTESSSLAPIRALMRRWLALHGATRDEAQDIVLAVGELASNACTHASPMVIGTLEIQSRLVDGAVHVTVADQGRWRPPLDRGGGRGLTIVRAVVDTLTIESDDEGTRAHIVRALTSPSIELART